MTADVDRAAEVVRSGGVLLYPTETVYGLGCDPRREEAVARIRTIKGRDADRPMLALTDRWGRVEPWVAGITDAHRRLMQHDLALTIIFEAGEAAPPALVSPTGEIGIRRTLSAFCRALVAAAGPVLSTSANRGGEPAVADFADLNGAVTGAVDIAVDAGEPLGGVASTVVRIEHGAPVVLREGAVDAATLHRIVAGG